MLCMSLEFASLSLNYSCLKLSAVLAISEIASKWLDSLLSPSAMAEEASLESVDSPPSTADVGEKMEQMGWRPHQIKYAMKPYEPNVLTRDNQSLWISRRQSL